MPDALKKALGSYRGQRGNFRIDVVIASNHCSPEFRKELHDRYISAGTTNVTFHEVFTENPMPYFACLNLAVSKFLDRKRYDTFIMTHEDVFLRKSSDLKTILSEFSTPDVGVVFGWSTFKNAPGYSPLAHHVTYILQYGAPLTVKLSDQPAFIFVCFDRRVYEEYGFRFVDLMKHSGGDACAVLLPYLIGLKSVYCTKVKVAHDRKSKKDKYDGRRYGFQGLELFGTSWEELMATGRELGFYRHVKSPVRQEPADLDILDETIRSNIKPELLEWVKDKLFVKPEQIDYASIPVEVTYGRCRPMGRARTSVDTFVRRKKKGRMSSPE